MKPMKKFGCLLLALLLATSAVQGDTPSTTSNNPLGLPQYEENMPLKVCKRPIDPCRTLEERLPKLVDIMDHLGWTNGRDLMLDWFGRSANNNPKQDNNPNIDTIKMDWVLGYERAKKVYDKAIAEKVWVNTPAKKVIEDQLIRSMGKIPINVGDTVTFGSVGEGQSFTPAQMKQFDEDYHFQHRPVNSSLVSDPLDDLFAALANFNFQFITQGTVERLPDVDGKARYKVTLEKVGIYVKDSYDFNDIPPDAEYTSQPLGYWNCVRRKVYKTPGFGAYYVTNWDFREWRSQYGDGMGGDFLVFSDIKVIDVDDTFEF
jgi:hypothetical protein